MKLSSTLSPHPKRGWRRFGWAVLPKTNEIRRMARCFQEQSQTPDRLRERDIPRFDVIHIVNEL